MAAWDEANGSTEALTVSIAAALARFERDLRARALWLGVGEGASIEEVVAACEASDHDITQREEQQRRGRAEGRPGGDGEDEEDERPNNERSKFMN